MAALLITAATVYAFAAFWRMLVLEERTRYCPVRRVLHATGAHELLYHGQLARHFRDWSAWERPPAPVIPLIGRPPATYLRSAA